MGGSSTTVLDDGTKMVRIIGCDHKLLESEILDWLALFGDVLTEILEELYEDPNDQSGKELPPIGNGNYLVKMKMNKDLPNVLPIYGRRIIMDHKGIRRQCNDCYGPHIRNYCKNKKMGFGEFVSLFKVKHPQIPEEFYGKLAGPENAEKSSGLPHLPHQPNLCLNDRL